MVVVATHHSRILPPADRIVELVPALATTDRPAEWVELEVGAVVFEQCAMGDPIYVLAAGELDIVRQLPGGDEESLKVVKRVTTSARSVRCSTCCAPRRCGRAPTQR
jgi:putative ABC transport system ATP-binding protein